MNQSETPDLALRALADAAHNFALKWKPRPRFSDAYARALQAVVDAARAFAAKSDEEWATEVGELRDALRRSHDINLEPYGRVCMCKLCGREQ